MTKTRTFTPRTKYHRDGSVTIWNVYAQSWQYRVKRPSDRVLASLNAEERAKVIRHCQIENDDA